MKYIYNITQIFFAKLITFMSYIGFKIGLQNILFFRRLNYVIVKYFSERKNFAKIKTIYGFTMEVSRFGLVVEKSLIEKGYWDKKISNIVLALLKKGDTFIDVGANIGYYSLLVSRSIGNNGHIIAFEPEKNNHNLLQSNIKHNKYTNIIAHKMGLGSKPEHLFIQYTPSNPGGSSIIKDITYADQESIVIDTLDNIMQEKRVDIIKIDVEGYEIEAIHGMKNILMQQKPSIILEFSPVLYESRYSLEEIKKFINDFYSLGYNIYHIIEDEEDINYLINIDKKDISFYIKENEQTNILITIENITVLNNKIQGLHSDSIE